ncbi:MAG: hypothetical protein JW740_00645 [Candidatus Zambryskibacteria bacterium]|nr:hypothetical protein [Candidatus Zambryskibacteria bacterium]
MKDKTVPETQKARLCAEGLIRILIRGFLTRKQLFSEIRKQVDIMEAAAEDLEEDEDKVKTVGG